jgi:putative transcriptional regulator
VLRFLRSLLLLAAICLPVLAEDAASKAILLVARKNLPDPFFRDSVVLVTNAGRAPLGVIINKPLDMKLADALTGERKARLRDEKLFFGGPVGSENVLFVYRAKDAEEDALQLMDGLYMSASRQVLDRLLARDEPLEGLRIFAGHAGWEPGQLEGEIARGDWALAPAEADAIFKARPQELWRELRAKADRTKIRFRP